MNQYILENFVRQKGSEGGRRSYDLQRKQQQMHKINSFSQS